MSKVSLADFAEKVGRRKPGFACWCCTIPEAAEMNEQRRKGVTIPIIREWLVKERGYPLDEATRTRLDRHFSTNRHHE